ncbi:MAG: hypothetical protein JO279_10890 [Verrucomicrobia bacterium]|nr:hypothetical protein [Verrucomicrobiota bacterium]
MTTELERPQIELREAFRDPPASGFSFQLPDLFSPDDMPRFVLDSGFQFIGQQSSGKESVQRLATPLGATNADAARSMPQFDPRPPEKTLLKISF